jgi:hypothetical protein
MQKRIIYCCPRTQRKIEKMGRNMIDYKIKIGRWKTHQQILKNETQILEKEWLSD